MSGPEFFQTRMGQTFFEETLPAIANSLLRIADQLEIVVESENRDEHPETKTTPQLDDDDNPTGFINHQGDGPSGFDYWHDNKWIGG